MAQIRGLINFIGDIRNCKTEEEERERVETELAKIRSSFAKSNVGGYAKKKYMWKVMYMYILGYPVDFGHMQCVDLIRSDTWTEKNVGYVGVSLLLIEYTELLRLCINTIKTDLKSKNEMFQCLALTCVANVGGSEFAEALKNDVEDLLLSGTSRFFVRKKSALCLLRLIRHNPDNLPSMTNANEIIKIATQSNIGVVTSVMALLKGLVVHDTDNYGGIVPVAVDLLDQYVIGRECAKEYIYYRTPCPWLQVKLLNILQHYPPPKDNKLKKLQDILERIISKTEVTSNVNKNHADHSILFEAMNVIIHLNLHDESMLHDRAIQKLLHFINVKEGNIRYLGLDAMTRLAKIAKTHKKIKGHLRTIRYSLDDNDISIRKRALDLLYGICDEDNVVEIIDHLLRYLNKAEYDMREDMVLKIAVLAEKYATDLQWYINVVLQLLTMAGDFVSDDVWHRVIQIITNNEDLQKYSVEKVLESINVPPVHESTIKVAGYILGEFGHLLENVSGKEQFNALHKHFQTATVETKALLLSTYMKLTNLYPEELLQDVVAVFKSYNAAVDPELQQRAVEYEVMATYDDQDLIGQIWEAMPDFPERESNLMKKVRAKAGTLNPFSDEIGSGDEEKESNSSDGDDEDDDSEEEEDSDDDDKVRKKKKKSTKTPNGAGKTTQQKVSSSAPAQAEPEPQQTEEVDLLSGLFGGDIMGSSNTNGSSNGGGGGSTVELTSDVSAFKKILGSGNGIIFDDQKMLRIGIKTIVDQGTGVMKILFLMGNRTDNAINNVSAKLIGNLPSVTVQFASHNFVIAPKQEFQLKCKASLISPYKDSLPIMKLTFDHNGTNYVLNQKLPIVPTRFFKPHNMDANVFKTQWGQNNQQAQHIVTINENFPTVDSVRTVLTSTCGLGIVPNIEKNANNTSTCGVCTFAKKKADGNYVAMGVLLRFEYNPNMGQMRITVRSKHALTSDCVLLACKEIFS